jgi:DNA polymerase III epsilon subunit-like protein
MTFNVHQINPLPVSNLVDNYISLDLEFAETKSDQSHLPLQIAAIAVINGQPQRNRFNRFAYFKDMLPTDFIRGMELADMTPKTYRKYGDINDIIKHFLKWWFDASKKVPHPEVNQYAQLLPVLGYNINSDLTTLVNYLPDDIRPNQNAKNKLNYFDVEQFVAKSMGADRISLQSLAHLLNVETGQPHHADNDSLTCATIYELLKARFTTQANTKLSLVDRNFRSRIDQIADQQSAPELTVLPRRKSASRSRQKVTREQ